MAKILVLYATKYGQTEKISNSMAEELRHLGDSVDVVNVSRISSLSLRSFDAVIVGAPVYGSKYPGAIRTWIKANVKALASKPTAFFSVCLGILETKNHATQDQEMRFLTDFFATTGWQPNISRIFAGAVLYTSYNWFLRIIMKRICAKAGGDTDTERDFEYTDWEDVRRFAREFSSQASHRVLTSA